MAIDFRLYFISDRRFAVAKPLPIVFRDAATLGVRGFQIREKYLDHASLKELAGDIDGMLKPFNAHVFINAHEDLACELGLNLQLTEHKIKDIQEIRKNNHIALIGASTHSRHAAQTAQEHGADFILFGPVYETDSKRQYGPPQGVMPLRELCKLVTIPVFAIGGVTPDNARQCMDAGAHGVACIGALMNTPDLAEAVGRFNAVLGGL